MTVGIENFKLAKCLGVLGLSAGGIIDAVDCFVLRLPKGHPFGEDKG
jgi:hypothetical protein